jgi:hypothetical protein
MGCDMLVVWSERTAPPHCATWGEGRNFLVGSELAAQLRGQKIIPGTLAAGILAGLVFVVHFRSVSMITPARSGTK